MDMAIGFRFSTAAVSIPADHPFVVNFKPLDVELLCSLAKKNPRIITIEENVRQGGFGSAVLESLNDSGITDYQLERIGIPDTFVEHGPQNLLRSKYGIDADAIVETAKRLMNPSGKRQDEWPSSQAV